MTGCTEIICRFRRAKSDLWRGSLGDIMSVLSALRIERNWSELYGRRRRISTPGSDRWRLWNLLPSTKIRRPARHETAGTTGPASASRLEELNRLWQRQFGLWGKGGVCDFINLSPGRRRGPTCEAAPLFGVCRQLDFQGPAHGDYSLKITS